MQGYDDGEDDDYNTEDFTDCSHVLGGEGGLMWEVSLFAGKPIAACFAASME